MTSAGAPGSGTAETGVSMENPGGQGPPPAAAAGKAAALTPNTMQNNLIFPPPIFRAAAPPRPRLNEQPAEEQGSL